MDAGTDPHFMSKEIFDAFFERFWDYPSEIYTFSCKFVLNVCKIQDNMSKVVTLLTKSLSFLVKISDGVDRNSEETLNLDYKSCVPIIAVSKAICESWKILS